jgi:photosystem II stability/assembly factor-like uncharacterized protein
MNLKSVSFLIIYILLIQSSLVSQQWKIQKSLSNQNLLTSVSVVDNKIAWVCGFQKTILLTNDGTEWISVNSSQIIGEPYTIHALSDSIAFVGTFNSPNEAKIFRTTNAGSMWEEVVSGTQDGIFINTIYFRNMDSGFAISDPALNQPINSFISLQTSNGGTSWLALINAICLEGESSYNNCLSMSNNYGWFGTSKGRIFKTTDYGSTWEANQNFFVDGKIQGISFLSEQVGIMFTLNAQNNGGFWNTKNGGLTWEGQYYPGLIWLGVPIANVPELNKFWITGSRTVQASNKIFSSIDSGKTIIDESVENIISGSGIRHLQVVLKNDSLFGVAVTSSGQILGYHNTITDVRPNVKVPMDYNLYQNYPNPFNPSTTIKFALPIKTNLSLSVYNTLGEKVAEIFNGELEAGYHEMMFNASSLSSGVYFYKIESENYSATKKMLLMK